MSMNRRAAREAAFELLFETEFKTDEAREDIFALSTENREIEENAYVKDAYFGVCEHLEEIENAIGEKLRQLADKVKAHRNADVPALCRDLLTDIKIRNEQCKSHK